MGTMFFAHLLIPHNPYSIDSNCKIRRPVVDWKLIELPTVLSDGRVNSDSSRAARYDDYVDQTQCALAKVGELIDALKSAGKFEGSTIIIHGDHGSRISRYRIRTFFKDQLSDQDYYDSFSTLFAVKAPHIAAGYDLRMLPIERLLRHVVDKESVTPDEAENHFVYLRDEPLESTFIKVTMPEIPGS